MMNLSIILLVVAVFAASHAKSIDLDREVDNHWNHYKAHHPKKHHSTQEQARKANFRKTHYFVERHNNGNHTFKMAHNQFSDMHEDEKKMFLGAVLPEIEPRDGWTAGVQDRYLPASIDHRTDRCLQPVKNQGSCGSCWTFSAICPLEFAKCKQTGVPVALSEQHLVDCDTTNSGCNGGWPTQAWAFLQWVGGSEMSYYYPYSGTGGRCAFNPSAVGAKVASSGWLAQNPTALMTALQSGPISVTLTVVDSFMQYRSGVYRESTCNNQNVNHAIVAVGYGTLNGVDYWIVRNSWGAGWGIGGYALVQRGVNMCGIESYAAAVVAA